MSRLRTFVHARLQPAAWTGQRLPGRAWVLSQTSTKSGGAQLPGRFGRLVRMPPTAALPRNNRQLVFTSSQAARYLGVSLATIRRWTDAGHISCYRTPGGQRRFAREQLDAFITSMYRNGREQTHANGTHEHDAHNGASAA